MSEQPAVPGLSAEESERMKGAFKDIAERSQKLLQDFAEKYKADGPQPADPLRLTQTFMDFTAKMLADPNRLLQARWLQHTVKEVEGVDDKTAKKVDFYTRQFIDAMSPSNFAMTNPQVVKATLESKGENLVKGLQNLLTDLERGKGKLAIRQTDMDAFKVGENVATSPGKVVFQNELIQLIQYAPATEEVYQTPLLI